MKESCKELLLEGTFSDFTIKTGNGSLRAHKAMLAAYSPVFKKMLTSDFSETVTGVMEVPDVSLETMREFLIFFYTQDLAMCDGLQTDNPTTPLLLDIMRLSHKYGLHEVVDVSTSFTSFINSHELITADSVLEFFQLSRWLSMESMRKTCVQFVDPILEEVLKKENSISLCVQDGTLASDLLLDTSEIWKERWGVDKAKLETAKNEIAIMRAGWDADKAKWEAAKKQISTNCSHCRRHLVNL